ncbi:hypothetical protein NT6N_33530 [Oceaniferula spumae]|uniref:Tyrosine kinase G-rich domain-containing protein n=1 Tax=Oceaniferula spumae TaxID=2979115 RepID=A0AAT9FQQ9_9BACT
MVHASATEAPPVHSPQKPARAPGRFRPGKILARWWWLVVIVMVVVIGCAYKLPDWFKMRGPLYESTALLEVKPIPEFDSSTTTGSAPISSGPSTHAVSTSHFMSTQEEIVKAQATLELALKKMDLLNRLGGNQIVAIDRIRTSLRVSQKYGTDLLEITFRDEDPLLAQDAVTAIFESYNERRTELEMQLRDDRIKALRVQLGDKHDRVAELRQRLMRMAENEGIVWQETDEASSVKKNVPKSNEMNEKLLYEAQREKEQIQYHLKRLTDLDVEELIRISSAIPGIGFAEHYKKYTEAQDELEAKKATGLADNHPDIQQKTKVLEDMRASLAKRAANVKKALDFKLESINHRIEKLNDSLNQQQEVDSTRSRSLQEFNIARKEYQSALNIKDQLEVKYDIEKAKLVMPPINHVIHERPTRPSVPVTKGRDFYTTLFTLISVPFAAVGAIILIYLAEAVFPRRA